MSKRKNFADWMSLIIILVLISMTYVACNWKKDKADDIMANITQNEHNELIAQIQQLQLDTADLKKKLSKQVETPTAQGKDTDQIGIYFEVQIGAFRFFNLNEYLKETCIHINHDEEDDLNKYTLVRFRSYEGATNFKQDIQVMGIEDAFIVAKKDSKRISIDEALTEVI